ncbi:hypothetical protein Clacol_005843 [Clathrus columnatus]|uniref:BED-type domain-containing protein n=1 Tax=Clathrus columnatus TaxID=1419009 RepID=A0AAV5AG16_9AGAM|nr:hypothetical protein Clacol_005843 [Clathrus columnatus]
MPVSKKKTKNVPPNLSPTSISHNTPQPPPHNTTLDLNCMQIRGVTGNTRYQNAIFYMNTQDNDGNLPEDCILPASPTTESAPPKWKNTRWGPNPPTKQTQVQNRKQRDQNRQQCLARNDQEDLANDISRMFEMNNDESQSRPITPPSITTEQPAQQLSPLLPSIPPHFTPTRPQAPQLVAPIEATSPEELDIIPAMEKLIKMSAQDVWFFFCKGKDNKFCKLCHHCQIPDGIYSEKTSTGVLHGHLIRKHRNEYIEACQKNSWQPTDSTINTILNANKIESPCH